MSSDLNLQQRMALKSIARPLGFIFWGFVLTILDFKLAVTVAGEGASVDLLPDWLGMILVTIGMGILALSTLLTGVRETAVTISAAVFLTLSLISIGAWFLPELDQLSGPVAVLLQVVAAAAVVAFCASMATLANELRLSSVARAWALIAAAVMVLYTLPQLLVVLVPSLTSVVLIASGVLVIGLAAVLLVTISSMRRIATSSVPPERQRSGTV